MTSYAGEGMIATLHATGDLIDLIYKFNLQAVGYSSSSLPRETRTTHNKTNNNIHNLQKQLTTQHSYSSYNKNIHYYITKLIKKVSHNTALGHPQTHKKEN